MSDLKRYRENITKNLKHDTPTTMAQSVDVQLSVPRLAKVWNRFTSDVEKDGPKSYY